MAVAKDTRAGFMPAVLITHLVLLVARLQIVSTISPDLLYWGVINESSLILFIISRMGVVFATGYYVVAACLYPYEFSGQTEEATFQVLQLFGIIQETSSNYMMTTITLQETAFID